MARILLRILGVLEIRFRFQTISAYLRTYHNHVADLGTRSSLEDTRADYATRGLTEVDATAPWEEILSRSYDRQVLASRQWTWTTSNWLPN